MFSPIVLKYNQKYFKLNSLYKINLYFIDQEYYIDISEVEKFQKWFNLLRNNSGCFKMPINHQLTELYESYNEKERASKNALYIENDGIEDDEKYTPISMNDYLLSMVEKLYQLLCTNIFDKYKNHLNDLFSFKKPDNTFKQIISPDGEIIYVVHFKKHINEPHHSTSIGYEKLNWDIEISIDDIFDINHLYPLNLSKILNEKKIKDSPYT